MPAKKKKKSSKKQSTFFGIREPEWLDIIHLPNWMVLILALIFLFRIPSFFEPFYYGDEMIYLNLGNAIKRGLVLYRDIHDNKPPLLYFVASIAGNVFWFRAILAGWMMATTVAFYKLVKTLFPKNVAVTQSAVSVFAILTTIPLLEGQIANSELFMIGPIILAFYWILSKKHSFSNLFFSGILFAIGTLFKMPSMFDIGTIVFFWLIIKKPNFKNLFETIKESFIILIGFLTPILISFAWYNFQGAFDEYITAAFLQNIGYLSSWRPDDVVEPFWVRNAPLLARSLIVLLGSFILFIFRKKLSKQFIFATLWLLFSLFAATLSERPYPHYLIQVVPSISILLGILIAYPSIDQSLTIIPLSIVLLSAVHFKFWYYPTFSYYQNFAQFVSGNKTKWEYFDGFSKNSYRDYKIAKFLINSSRVNDKVFIWGDSPTVYALSNRLPPIKYVADYHINDFSSLDSVAKSLEESPPSFIILMPNANDPSSLLKLIRDKYTLVSKIQGANIYKKANVSLNLPN